MLLLTISIPPDYETQVSITNVGHPQLGGHPEFDDLRTYWVECPLLPGVAEVEHRRSDGSWKLIELVMAKLDEIRLREGVQ